MANGEWQIANGRLVSRHAWNERNQVALGRSVTHRHQAKRFKTKNDSFDHQISFWSDQNSPVMYTKKPNFGRYCEQKSLA